MNITNKSNITYNAVEPDNSEVAGSLVSNTVNTEVLSDVISKEMVFDKTFAKEGEIVHNIVTISNGSSADLSSAFISSPAPKGASYVKGSVKINGTAQPDADPATGLRLPDLESTEIIIIEFDMKIDSPATATTITNSADFQFNVIDPIKGNVTFNEPTNAATVNVVISKLSVVKSVDKAFAVKGDTLTYTITFTNEGNINIKDIYFTDNIPQGTTFVEGSVWINDQNPASYRPDTGYNVANLPPNDTAVTRFQVTVD